MLISLVIINILFILAVIFTEHRRPHSAVVWTLILTLLPVIGMFLYIFFGRGFYPYKNKVRDTDSPFYDYLSINKKDILEEKNKTVKRFRDLILFNLTNSESIFSKDNTLTLFTDAKEKYQSLFTDILNAKHSINIEYFIIRNDEVGRDFIGLLAMKAREGVKVNLIYDELATLRTNMKCFKPLIDAGGNVYRFFHSIGLNILKVNHRNHRKIAIIDGKCGYIGGMNIGLEYMGLKKLKPWRDTHLKIEGSAVYSLQAAFLNDLIYSGSVKAEALEEYFPKNDFPGNKCMQIISSNPALFKEEIKLSFLKLITGAKKSIYIQTPYFVPDRTLTDCLKTAALSGVDVRIMIPGKPDKKYIYYITLSHIDELLQAGVKFYIHKGFLHSKTLIADCRVTSIGTANFDMRSFMLNYEVNAFIYDKDFSLKNLEAITKDMEKCTELTSMNFSKRSFLRKLAERILKLFSPLV